jgi:hypothetical protein
MGTKCGHTIAARGRDERRGGTPILLLRFLFRQKTQQEHAMPYLFWAVLPFALMDTWWGMCEQRRDIE